MFSTPQKNWITINSDPPDGKMSSPEISCHLTKCQDMAFYANDGGARGSSASITPMSQCPDQHAAKKFYQKHLSAHTLVVLLSDHAKDELAKDDMDMVDCMNVLRGGVWQPPEWETSWRYRVSTQKMAVVIAIDDFNRGEVTVVTAWRNKKRT